jgi:D-alanine-D-alanine ligase
VPIRIEKDGRWALAERAPSAMSAAEVIEHARLEAGRAPRVAREVHLMARPSDEPLLSIDRAAERPGVRNTAVDRGDGQGAVVQSMGLDVVFPVLHGPYGEDGTVQGLLELANLPYVGCGVLASAVGMDKGMMKVVFAQHGLPQVEYAVVLRSEWARDRAGVRAALLARLPAPLFVKPANLGSSVGISKVHDAGELDAALDLAAGFDRKIVVEAGVPNAREIECAVLGNDTPEASTAGEVVPSREFYDYEAKYLDEGSKTIIPADLTAAQLADVQRLSKAAFLAIDGTGLARVDFLLCRDDGRLYVNEVNTLPGFTTISMYSKLWEASGVSYSALIDRLIALAMERHAAKQQLRTSVL